MRDNRSVTAILLIVLSVLACQGPPRASSGNSRQGANAETWAAGAPKRDLSLDEAAGGHTLHKHVGRTDEQLRERLDRERNISAASTWTDRETAERAVGTALLENRDKIERWLRRTGGHPNLVIDYDGDASHPIGRSLRRGSDQAEPCAHALVILKWAGPNDYYLLTSYPECR